MARILFVTASFEEVSLIGKTHPNSHYPLGLAYLHSFLEGKGHQVETLGLNHEPFPTCRQQVLDALARFRPDVLGFQILTANRVATYQLLDEVHGLHPSLPVLLGGIHTCVMYRQLLERFPYAIAVLGEGEETCHELLQALGSRAALANIHGLAYWEDGKVRLTPMRALLQDLDQLPFPKHEIFFTGQRTLAGLLSSRGCVFKCSFCVLDSISRRRVRMRSPENVVDEIEHLVRSFPNLETIWFHDDAFFFDPKRTIAICDEIIRRKIQKKFICSARFKPISRELVDAVERAGFTQILFGLESASDLVREKAHKHVTKEDAISAIELFRGRKMAVGVFVMVGLPGETRETVLETARFVQRLQKIKYMLEPEVNIILRIFPGTEIYDLAVQAGVIDDGFWLTDESTPFFTAEHDLATLEEFRDLLLDHICLYRLTTVRALHYQRTMLPQVLKFLLFETSPREALRIVVEPLIKALRVVAPGVVDTLLDLYRRRRA